MTPYDLVEDAMKKHPATPEHNYLKKVAAYLAAHPKQDVRKIVVQHDPWCNALRNKVNGFCNCDPVLSND